MRVLLLLCVNLAAAVHDTTPACTLPPEYPSTCFYDPCPVGQDNNPADPSTPRVCVIYPECHNGGCACGGTLVVGKGPASSEAYGFAGISTNCFISKVGCPFLTYLADNQPAFATNSYRTGQTGVSWGFTEHPTCDEIVPSPPSSPSSAPSAAPCVDSPDAEVAAFAIAAGAPVPVPNCATLVALNFCGPGGFLCCASCPAQTPAPVLPPPRDATVPWSISSCKAESEATKTYLEQTATRTLPSGSTVPYLMPCPRAEAAFTAAQYETWYAAQFEASAKNDPHFHFAHGGRADIRGEPGAVYNVLSHRNVSMNVEFAQADFRWNQRLVHGTKFTAAYWKLRTVTGKVVTVEMHAPAQALNKTASRQALGRVQAEEGEPVFVSQEHPFESANVAVKMVDGKLIVSNGVWEMSARIAPFPFAALNKGKMLINVAIKPLHDVEKDTVAPHGLIGQSWDGDDIVIDGAMDTLRGTETTTKAQGEGAIEGIVAEYKMAGPHATDFKYSRFNAHTAKPRDVSKLTGKRHSKGAHNVIAGASSSPDDMVEVPIVPEHNEAAAVKAAWAAAYAEHLAKQNV